MSYNVTKNWSVPYIDHYYTQDGNGNVIEHEIEKWKEVSINVHVDTTPFDQSVDSCDDNIGNLTTSVVGFQAANVASKQENERLIVDSATAGFSSMIEQHLSLQNAGLEAEMHALAGELMQQCKELSHKRDVMSNDFNRIKSRYTELFETLNKELTNRIRQTLKPCLDFVSQIRKEQNRRIESSLLSIATTGGKESDAARIAIQTSKMKHNGEQLINSARDFIIANYSMNRAKKAFFVDGNNSEVIYAPVLIVEERNETSTQDVKIYSNPIVNHSEQVEKTIRECAESMVEKEVSQNEKSSIENYFNQFLSEMSDGSIQSQRIVSLMSKMFNNNQIKTYRI